MVALAEMSFKVNVLVKTGFALKKIIASGLRGGYL